MMGLIKGFAEGTSDRITKEREEEKTLIANRFKMAAINKKQREEEDKVKKEAAKARNEQINTLLPGASLEQRLALMSNETMFNLAIENKDVLADKEKLDEFIVINKEKIPANFKTVQDYINSLTSKPQGPSKMPEMQTREVFFSRVSPDQKQMDAMASQYGSSAADLLAYEGVSEAEAMPSFGSVNIDVLKKNKSIKDRLSETSVAYADAVSTYGKDSSEAAAVKTKYDGLKEMEETLEPKQANWASYVGGLKLSMLTGKTPQERAEASKEYDRVLALEARGKKEKSDIPSANTLSTLFSRTATKALNEKFGSEVKNDLITETAADGSSSFKYIGTDPQKKKEVYNYSRSVIKDMASPYLDKEGRPLNTDVETALRTMLIPFDEQGRPIFTASPAEPAPVADKPPALVIPPKTTQAAPAVATLPEPKTQEEYDALPPSTEYRDTDGKVKRKK